MIPSSLFYSNQFIPAQQFDLCCLLKFLTPDNFSTTVYNCNLLTATDPKLWLFLNIQAITSIGDIFTTRLSLTECFFFLKRLFLCLLDFISFSDIFSKNGIFLFRIVSFEFLKINKEIPKGNFGDTIFFLLLLDTLL